MSCNLNYPIIHRPAGFYCPAGDFYIDPLRPVDRAIITHGHADHARPGSKAYLTSSSGLPLVRKRVNSQQIEGLPFRETRTIGNAIVSLHPAGHLLGSAQVRVEVSGRVSVITGDYKREPDPTCEMFEVVKCHHLVTECTFGLPVYRWPDMATVFDEIHDWWRANQEVGRTSVLLCYALGKAQRVLAGLDPNIGTILLHGAMTNFDQWYREAGIHLPPAQKVTTDLARRHKGKALVLAPPSAAGTTWIRKFTPCSLAFASGWMLLRGTRRRRAVDRGFVVSDHADWPSLLDTIQSTSAEEVWATHGYTGPLVRYLRQTGINAREVATRFGDGDENEEPTEA